MFRLKPSYLESFRIIRDGIFEKDPEEFHKQIRGEFEENEAMKFGSLVHYFLETGNHEKDNLKLYNEEILQLSPIYNMNKDRLKEVKATYKLNDNITISYVVDAVDGIAGFEFKTGKRFYGVDFYNDSIQWKCYCLGLDLKIFNYLHIQYGIKRPYQFTTNEMQFFPNENTRDEVERLCYDFIEYCYWNNLENYIQK